MVEGGLTGGANLARSWFCAGLIAMLSWWPIVAVALERGDLAPEFSLPVLANPTAAQNQYAREQNVRFPVLDFADYRGRVVYLDFWNSACLPCRESLPLLSALQEEFRGSADHRDIEIVAVNTDSNPQHAVSFMAEHPVSYAVVSDPAGLTATAYGLTSLPTAFFVARDGTVEGVHQGFRNKDIAEIRARLTALSARPDSMTGSYE